MLFRVVYGDRRRESGSLGVEQFVGHLESGRKAAGVTLLVLGGAQPEVDLQLGLNHPATRAGAATARELEKKLRDVLKADFRPTRTCAVSMLLLRLESELDLFTTGSGRWRP